MTARSRTEKWEVITSVSDFYRRTGMICEYSDIEWLGFELDNYCGIFDEKTLPMLINFCNENPAYHIVTSVERGRLVNRYVPDKNVYGLANGDKNQFLVLNQMMNPERSLIDEELICKALAMLHEPKGSG